MLKPLFRWSVFWAILTLLALLSMACGSEETPAAVPLSFDQTTFLFFFTDP